VICIHDNIRMKSSATVNSVGLTLVFPILLFILKYVLFTTNLARTICMINVFLHIFLRKSIGHAVAVNIFINLI